MGKKTIVVNNPAAKNGGVLTILKQFLDNIYKNDTENFYYVITSVPELLKYKTNNIKIEVISRQSFRQRIFWDNLGLKKFLKKKKINPDLFISFQNTGVNLPNKIPQIIYYQQPLSLSKENWSFFQKDERLFWLYKNIYPFFIKQYLNRVKKVVVQTEWVKEEFCKCFGYPKSDIELIKPEINLPNVKEIISEPKEKFRIFYPAATYKYKNHFLLIKSLAELKKLDLECVFTFAKEDNPNLFDLIKKYDLEEKIKLVGKIEYEKVLKYYKSADLIVFPSTIETFGLPLIEAASFGKKILVIDKPYSREVIGNYQGAKFISNDDLKTWSEEIRLSFKFKKTFECFKSSYESSWDEFFRLIKRSL